MKKSCLITGGAGFIGSHLCRRLLAEDNNVICLDNLSSGKFSNIEELLSRDDFSFIRHDVTQPLDIDIHLDEIYNLACPASPVAYQKDPIKTMMTSVLGMQNALELARQNNCRILQASTSEVYGDPLQHPQSETYHGNVNTLGIRSCYDEGKRCAEGLCMDYHRNYGVKVKIIRIFNTYGPRMAEDDGRVVSNFIVQALRQQDITVYGEGRQTRSFQYIDDLIEGMVRMMETPDDFTGPVNIGNPAEYTVMELADTVIALTQSHSAIIKHPIPQDDPRRRCPDISLATERLHGWLPKVKLENGLKETINYFRKAIV